MIDLSLKPVEKQTSLLSVVSPVYGCSTSLVELYIRLKKTLTTITDNYEIIFVNDGSPDNDWEIITKIAKNDDKVKGICFSRNFGQHYAINAGLEYSKGEWVVVMDCDLQDRPEEIFKLYETAALGYSIVLGKRSTRKDTVIKKLLSKVFYKVLSYFTETKQDYSIANFGIYNRKVVDAILKMKDHFRYFPAKVKWVGFKSTTIDVEHSERKSGKSMYSFRKLRRLGINVILSFSDKPLRLTLKFGLLISFSSMIFALYNLYKYLNGEIVVSGWTSLIISIWFLSGIIIFVLGVVGLYIGKIFDKVKDRPLYIVDDTINL